jgi:cytochrome c-type biogenesis protein
MNIFDTFFLTVNAWMTSGSAMAYVGCFAWGMISVLFSPCHLASIPLVVAYVAGQESALNPKQACLYAGAFASGLFATISLIGVICAGLGRLLGDVGSWWQVLVGAVLIWVALGMLGVQSCQLSGTLLDRMKLRGIHGAFGLGLAYGLISGSCTFGFIAPILAIITIQKQWATGVLMMLLFALGHCLPIMVAGSSTAVVRKLTENHLWHNAGNWFRRGAGAVIALLGVYFVFNPFIGT